MKSVAILTTMAAAVGAQQSLRGDWEQGVEEVGEQIEFFPNEMEYGMEALSCVPVEVSSRWDMKQ